MAISGVYHYSVFFYYVTFTNGESEILEKDNPLVVRYLKTNNVKDREK